MTAVKSISSKAKTNGKAAVTGPGSNDPFVYVTADGVTITVASMATPVGTMGEVFDMLDETNPLKIAKTIIQRDCTGEALAAVRAMTFEEFQEFSEAWAKHSGMSPGE